MISVGLVVILSYLVGSVPTSIIVARYVRGIDIRQFGSGNAGGTNVLRVLGWRAGVFVIAMDIAKGLFATMVVARLLYGPFPFPNTTPFDDFTLVQIMAGSSAILGHVWTLFAGFKGGKGIATSAGMLLGIAPVEVGVSFGVFLLVVLISHYVSLGRDLSPDDVLPGECLHGRHSGVQHADPLQSRDFTPHHLYPQEEHHPAAQGH
jgi:glycerol-3-phosphate acyltransferase PlsY